MSVPRVATTFLILGSWLASAVAAETAAVNESARKIPVAYDVDVVVVGGGTGAVSAAVAAAEAGAKVFLAAPYPYLGDDMTATLRLWLEPGETPASPLAKAIFANSDPPAADPNRLGFTYQADQPAALTHKDTAPPSKLSDGRFGDATTESVQYNGDVTITAALEKLQEIKEVRVIAYYRAVSTSAGGGYNVSGITVSTSDDQKTWKEAARIKNDAPAGEVLVLKAPLGVKARYVKFAVKKPANVERMLLGEIEIIGPERAVVEKPKPTIPPPRPMHVKKVLDDALLAAGVQYLYSCYATDVLRDAAGKPCGIVMANRAGRQAVVAKTIIDATDRAWVARMAGAEFGPYPTGTHTFRRTVIGGEVQKAEGMTARVVAPPFRGAYPNAVKTASGTFQVIEYTLQLPMKDDSYASWAAADQKARTMTYHPEQQFTSDRLFEVPPDAVQSQAKPAAANVEPPLAAFQPLGVPRLYVLGGCADVSRPQAAKLLRPLALIDLGARIGKAAAADAKALPAPKDVALPGKPTQTPAAPGDVRETLVGVRPLQQLATIPQDARAIPVLGTYDVVIIGGGTGGAPAGISAAKQGAKTLVIEYLHGLGGVGTAGAISSYYWGNRIGFSKTVEGRTSWVIEQKMEWWRKNLLEAGAEIWFGTIGCGALVRDGQVIGAVVATPQGRGVVLAKAVIDATGNADVAAAAGAKCLYTDETEFGMQGTGLPGRQLGQSYNNTDFTIVDETDMVDVWHVFVYAKNKYPQAFDQGQLMDTRERRRIVGDFTITLLDEINGRTYPDSVVQARSNFDTHGYTVDPLLLIEHPGHAGFNVFIPYRAMLPKGMEGVLVIGLGTSAHRDAVPLIRMQADIQNQGYAAGIAAATAAKENTLLRNIDIRKLQKQLIEIGNLPESVLEDKDSYPLPAGKVAAAVAAIKDGKGAPVVLAQPEQSLPLVKKAYAAAEGKDKLTYARLLAVMGDAGGLDVLAADVKDAAAWDKGWNYRGMGQFGAALSPLDSQIVALGRTGDRRAVPAIVEKLNLLSAKHDFSHHRAVGLALELIGDPAAAKPLAELLAKPGMTGYVHTGIDVAKQQGVPGGTNAEQTRRESLRELMLARALYRCGDYQGVGQKILEAYTHDLRGHLARHAKAVLEAGKK